MKKREKLLYPIILESKNFILYSYPLFMGLAWGYGYFSTVSLFESLKQETSKLPLLFLGLFICSWIGAKVFFLWFSSGHKIYQYLYADYFWLGGGFVFYGGLIFGLLFYFIWSLVLKKFDYRQSHLLIPGLIWGHSIGRVGCFLAGCCYGLPTKVFWAVKLHEEYRHPVQLYEALFLVVIAIIVLKMIKRSVHSNIIILFYLISYSLVRFLIESFRGDEIRGVLFWNLSSSQLVSMVIVSSSIIFLMYRKIKLK